MSLILSSSDAFQRSITGSAPARLAALDARLRPPRRTEDGRTIARAVRPSAALQDDYQRRLLALVREMERSALYWLRTAYRGQEDRIAELAGVAADAPPATDLRDVARRLRRRWERRFDDASLELARYFAKKVHRRSADELGKILRRGGFSVDLKLSPPVRSALRAIVEENVSLIKSIPQQYMLSVEGSVMRSVLAGRDLKTLTDEIEHHGGVTRRRAELIARDQNSKATSAIQRLQYLDVGIERAIWVHSHAGVTPRPTHLANDGNEFDIREGWLDPAINKRIWPGTEINCRCFSKPILPR